MASATSRTLLQLVRDEEDGDPLPLQLLEVAEELVDLARDEHGGGLVEDEDPRAAVEDLQDLHPLAVTDAQLLDAAVGIDLQPVGGAQLTDAGPRRRRVEAEALPRLRAEHDVLEDREVVGQHEVLVDHADPGGDGVGGRLERHLVALHGDGALVGAEHPVQDLHERRLARAVLPDDGVDLPRGDRQLDVAVGHDAGEPLDDPLQLDCRCDADTPCR